MEARAQALAARQAGRALAALSTAERVALLHAVADGLDRRRDEIFAENALDVADGQRAVEAGTMSTSLAARLKLSAAKLDALVQGIRAIADAEEPLGRTVRHTELASGLILRQETAPIGVLMVIFESRPDALPQVAALALRSGNGLILKGGKEAARSNAVLHRVIGDAVRPWVDPAVIGLVQTREQIADLLALDDVIDLVIPRGSNAMVHHIQQSTRIPVLGHADGVCHVYVDVAADPAMAIPLVLDSKTDYPAACNALETLLVHRDWGHTDALLEALTAAGVALHRGPEGPEGLPEAPALHHEYSALALTVQPVAGLEAAIDHIHAHGSGHTECIVTEDVPTAEVFLARVDAACIFHNASTRFADGYRFGLGAEVGIATVPITTTTIPLAPLPTTRWTTSTR